MFLLLLILVCFSAVQGENRGTYFVKPNSPSATCQSQPCYSLEYYLQNELKLFTQSNVTLKFLPGIHLLVFEQPVQIKDVQNFAMIGGNWNGNWKKSAQTSEVRCKGSVGFKITFSHNVTIEDLTFTNCGMVIAYKGEWLYKAALLIENVTDLFIQE